MAQLDGATMRRPDIFQIQNDPRNVARDKHCATGSYIHVPELDPELEQEPRTRARTRASGESKFATIRRDWIAYTRRCKSDVGRNLRGSVPVLFTRNEVPTLIGIAEEKPLDTECATNWMRTVDRNDDAETGKHIRDLGQANGVDRSYTTIRMHYGAGEDIGIDR
uniref:Uncharacterized protein n=1 Tax=Vespula pensylvanica TaxID=30213 RepID=A0A834KDM0_VESPE|nr:hypothetical protein H0235_015307 [Vespula pensylvanica]